MSCFIELVSDEALFKSGSSVHQHMGIYKKRKSKTYPVSFLKQV